MLKIINFFRGSVSAEIKGAYPERFLNLCAANGIGFWGMSRPEPSVIRISMTVSNYRRLREYAKKSMCHIHILKKTGLPFFTYRFKKRTILVSGFFIFIIIAWIMSSFIWAIDINGYDKVNISKLKDNLKQNGVYFGAYAPSVSIDELKNNILINMPELSFITVNLNGSHAQVQIRERTVPPKILSMDEPCNIIAKRGGIIKSIVVKSGTPAVKVGDIVAEGQLLAGGFMVGRNETTVIVHAVADVKARTWRTYTSKMPVKTLIKTATGRKKARKTLIIAGRRIKLFLNSRIPYKEYDKIINKSSLTLPGNIILPLSLETEVYIENSLSDFEIPQETMFEYMSGKLKKYIKLGDGEKLIKESYSAKAEKGAAYVTLTAECQESIGIEQLFPKGK